MSDYQERITQVLVDSQDKLLVLGVQFEELEKLAAKIERMMEAIIEEAISLRVSTCFASSMEAGLKELERE